MIKLLNTNKQVLHLLNQVKEYYTESTLTNGDKIIHFLIPRTLAAADDIKQEYYLRTSTDEYVIKEVNFADNNFIEVFGKLNTEGLRSIYFQNYEGLEQTLSITLAELLAETGWTSSFIDPVTKSRTIRGTQATAYDLILECANTYGVEIEFDTLTSTVKIYQTRGTNRGAYVYSDLNLRKSDYQSDTYNFTTRLYAYGADNLTFSSINDGKEYVENFTYSNKIVELIWKDDRYTDATSLLEDATSKLASLAVPRVSFTIDVLNLKGLISTYSILDFQLGDTVKIIDKNNEILDTQRIVKLTEYPLTPEKNVMEFSNVKITYKSEAKSIEDTNNEIEKIKTDLEAAIEAATDIITNSTDGYVVMRYNTENKPYELLIMDTDNVATAMKVWRWNVGGLGYSSTGYNGSYTTAITQDGQIVADFITTGTLDATVIKAGVLQSDNGTSWINMEDGTFSLGGGRLAFSDSSFTINYTGTELETILNDKANQDDIDEIHSYLTFGASGLTIGETNSPLQISISNEQMSFMDSNKIIAYINGQKMFISELEITSSLVVGKHKIEKYSSGDYTLIKYVG